MTVPKFAADWFEKNKGDLTFAIYEAVAHSIKEAGYKHYSDEFMGWFAHSDNNSIETLIRMKDGYEVEKEPLYQVKIPTVNWDEYSSELVTEYAYLIWDITSDEYKLSASNKDYKSWRASLTESEIKSIDERYWAFAVPVEEIE